MRSVSITLLMLLFVVGISAQPQSTELNYDKLGIHMLLDDGRNLWDQSVWAGHMDYADQITGEGGIAVQVIRADDLDADKWQVFLDLAGERDMTPVLRLATTFDRENGYWHAPNADPYGSYAGWGERYAAFINALVWPDPDAKHVILLNEPNNGHEWGGQPDPVAYAQFFVEVTGVLRDAVPGVVILNAALDLYAPDTGSLPFPGSELRFINAVTYMDAMVAAMPDVFAQVDVWNSHSYPMHTFTAGPWERAYHFDVMHDALPVTETPPEDVMNRGINGYEWELWRLDGYGVDTRDLPVMITEFGWRHSAGDEESADYAEVYPSPGQAAAYLDMALRGNAAGRYPDAPRDGWIPLLADPRVVAVAYFALDGVSWEWSHTNLLQVDADGAVIGTHAHYDLLAGYFNQ